ncbi:fimbrial biogenesis chaperone [Erwinia rhapontici]|uniref:fimbrial biogenesis chaperone n=1 Tax=Erwinia rhapontici TaxID=55212 RepID=UPI002166E535|nr:fimbria/pilus periplasmic chaperone [Erwinia rhapontici]MCS3607782.1 chaperone protein EcpD [Erwinia rhapontici]
MSVVSDMSLSAWKYLSFYLVASLLSQQANANVIINGTRVIYPQQKNEVNIHLSNDSDKPALVQSWIDNGDENAALDKISVPFVLTPPIVRIEPNSGQTLRITWTGTALPQDKESIFWLNILDIPPKSATAINADILQMAIRSRLKIFFRPPALNANGANQAFHDLQWQRSTSAPGTVLRVNNPSAYFINVSNVKIETRRQEIKSLNGEMIAPKSSAEFRFTALPERIENAALRYEVINDYGSITTVKNTQ